MAIQRKIPSAISRSWFVPGVVFAQERPYNWGIVAIVMGIRWLMREGQERRRDSALEILRQRYGRGEIKTESAKSRKKI